MSSQQLVVHKFGGTSVAGTERYRGVADIVLARPEPRRAVVVSAMSGVTDALVRAVQMAGQRDPAYRDELAALRERHRRTACELLPGAAGEEVRAALERDLADVEDVLRAAWIVRHAPRGAADMVAGLGEVWSARVLAAHLAGRGADADLLDARQVLVAEPGEGTARVDWAASQQRVDAWIAARGEDAADETAPHIDLMPEAKLPTSSEPHHDALELLLAIAFVASEMLWDAEETLPVWDLMPPATPAPVSDPTLVAAPEPMSADLMVDMIWSASMLAALASSGMLPDIAAAMAWSACMLTSGRYPFSVLYVSQIVSTMAALSLDSVPPSATVVAWAASHPASVDASISLNICWYWATKPSAYPGMRLKTHCEAPSNCWDQLLIAVMLSTIDWSMVEYAATTSCDVMPAVDAKPCMVCAPCWKEASSAAMPSAPP